MLRGTFRGLPPFAPLLKVWVVKNLRKGAGENFLSGVRGAQHFRTRLFGSFFKNLLMPLFLMGCFPVDFQEVKRPLRTKSGKRPIKVGKRPIKEGKRPIKAMVLVGISVSCLMGFFRAPLPWWKTAPLGL